MYALIKKHVTFCLHKNQSLKIDIEWCRLKDLNPQPTDYDSVALPIELNRHSIKVFKREDCCFLMVAPERFELPDV